MSQSYAPLIVSPEVVAGLRAIQAETARGEAARQELGKLLQAALQLEFATIPPYLAAAFSIRSPGDSEIFRLIVRVAKEEMLHMTVLANLMNAIGVSPDIRGAVPAYPFELTVLKPALRLNLRSFSLELIADLFMRIETPEEPVEFPTIEAVEERTIGQFYADIIELIESDKIPDLFKHAKRDAYRQIPVLPNFVGVAYTDNEDAHKYPLQDGFDFLITDKGTAVRYLRWIVAQGEGTAPYDPLAAEGLPGHYYRFQSIVKTRYLLKDTNVQQGYSFSGGDLVFSPDDVHEFDPNPKAEDYADHERVHRHMKRFNAGYTEMVDWLHEAFNCPSPEQEPAAKEAYQDAVGAMRRMPRIATAILQAAADSNVKGGTPFQYGPSAFVP